MNVDHLGNLTNSTKTNSYKIIWTDLNELKILLHFAVEDTGCTHQITQKKVLHFNFELI